MLDSVPYLYFSKAALNYTVSTFFRYKHVMIEYELRAGHSILGYPFNVCDSIQQFFISHTYNRGIS